jgi:CCR4-NOT transcription complex subunit 2
MTSKKFKLKIFDDSEFPSLSGAPQAQQNTSAQQIWANPSIRATQHSTIQRPQGQNPPQVQVAQQSNPQHQQLQNPIHEDGTSPAQGQYAGTGDDYRFGGQAGVGQLSGTTQPQTGNIEEFPPLGGAAGEAGPDRRTGMIQNAAYGANANVSAFPGLGQGQTRNGLSSPTDGQQDRSIGTAVGDRTMHAAGIGAGGTTQLSCF